MNLLDIVDFWMIDLGEKFAFFHTFLLEVGLVKAAAVLDYAAVLDDIDKGHPQGAS